MINIIAIAFTSFTLGVLSTFLVAIYLGIRQNRKNERVINEMTSGFLSDFRARVDAARKSEMN